MSSSKVTLTLAIFLVCMFGSTLAKKLSYCEVARTLTRYGIPRHQLNDWVCLVLHESNGDTAVVPGPNVDGSRDHGFFQINDRYWCNNGNWPGKGCNIKCRDLTNENLWDDVRCARHIYSIMGFSAWEGWKKWCRGTRLPDYEYCFH